MNIYNVIPLGIVSQIMGLIRFLYEPTLLKGSPKLFSSQLSNINLGKTDKNHLNILGKADK